MIPAALTRNSHGRNTCCFRTSSPVHDQCKTESDELMTNDRPDLTSDRASDKGKDCKAQNCGGKTVKPSHEPQKGFDTKTDGLTD
jgi:hypothetical protein